MTAHNDDDQLVGETSTAGSWPDDMAAIVRLRAAGNSYEYIADQLNVSTKTIQRRLQLPGVSAMVTRCRVERVEAITGAMVVDAEVALSVLRELMSSEDERVRQRAAEQVLGMGMRFHERLLHDELLERVEALEASDVSVQAADDQEARHRAIQETNEEEQA